MAASILWALSDLPFLEYGVGFDLGVLCMAVPCTLACCKLALRMAFLPGVLVLSGTFRGVLVAGIWMLASDVTSCLSVRIRVFSRMI